MSKCNKEDTKKLSVSIVIPAYNEEENLPLLLEDLGRHKLLNNGDYEIVIINDNSTDNTGAVAEGFSQQYKNIVVIHRKGGNRGMGAALKEGTRKSSGDLVIWIMADRSDDLHLFSVIIENLRANHDMVIASRYMKGGSRGDLNIIKAFLSSRFTVISRLVFGIPVHDITNAFRGFKREVFEKVCLQSDDFAISAEFAIKVFLLNFKLTEVPSTYRTREYGHGHFSIWKMMWRYLFLLRYRFTSTFSKKDPE